MNTSPDIKAIVVARIIEQFPGINQERLLTAVHQCADRNIEKMACSLTAPNCHISLSRK